MRFLRAVWDAAEVKTSLKVLWLASVVSVVAALVVIWAVPDRPWLVAVPGGAAILAVATFVFEAVRSGGR